LYFNYTPGYYAVSECFSFCRKSGNNNNTTNEALQHVYDFCSFLGTIIFLLFYLCLQQRRLCLYFSSETMQFWCCHLCVFLFLYVQWNVHPTSLDLICMYFDKANLLMKLRDCLENCIYENNAHCFYEIVAIAPMGENGVSNASLGASRPSHLFCTW
jgi:hypothetical protein